MTYKHKTVSEALETLEETVSDLVYFGVKPSAIHDTVDVEIERANEKREIYYEEMAE